MADGMASKAKKRARKAPAAGTRPPSPTKGEVRLAELEAECERLRSELTQAQERLAQLERQREVLVNRIDWVIDSLHSMLDE
jgi:chromosome segregation ATPase